MWAGEWPPSSSPSYYDVLNLLFWYEIVVYTHPGLLILTTPAYTPFTANLLSVKKKLGRDLSTRKITIKNIFRKTILLWKMLLYFMHVCGNPSPQRRRKKNAAQLWSVLQWQGAVQPLGVQEVPGCEHCSSNELCVVMQNLYSLWTLCLRTINLSFVNWLCLC